jgi:hypothetical protein
MGSARVLRVIIEVLAFYNYKRGMELAEIIKLCSNTPLNAETIMRFYLGHALETRSLLIAVLMIRKTRIFSTSPETYQSLANLLVELPEKEVLMQLCSLVGCKSLKASAFNGMSLCTLKIWLATMALKPIRDLLENAEEIQALLVRHLSAELDGIYQSACDRHLRLRDITSFFGLVMRFGPTTRKLMNERSDVLFAVKRDASPRRFFYYVQ